MTVGMVATVGAATIVFVVCCENVTKGVFLLKNLLKSLARTYGNYFEARSH